MRCLWFVCVSEGFTEVPLRGARHGRHAVHALGAAGQSSASGVQPERRDTHQTGSVLRPGGRPAAAGDRTRSEETP